MTEQFPFRPSSERIKRVNAYDDPDHAHMLCDEHLLQIYDDEEATRWWWSEHPILKGIPAVLFKHDPNVVISYVLSLRSRESFDY